MSGSAGLAVVAGLAGVPVGSFLNAVVQRTPDRAPLRARVEDEAHPLRSWAGVPVQPGLLRGGPRRGRRPRWVAVEVATAGVFAVLVARIGSSAVVVPLLVLGAALVAVAAIDLEHLRIPDRVTFPALALVLPLVVAVSLHQDQPRAIEGALVGAVAYFALLLLPHLAYPRGMGFGDVKLALLMGLVLGWLGWTPGDPTLGPLRYVLYALMLGCVAGVAFGLVHAAVTRRRGEFPFGPALAAACLVVTVWLP